MKTLRVAAAALLALSYAAASSAQPDAGPVYIEGGVIAPYQSGAQGEESVTYVTAPGGVTPGWTAGGGVYLVRRVSVHAEFASTGSMTAREPSRYGMTFNEERRDRFLTLGFRLGVPLARSFDLEPFVGIAFTFPAAWSQVEYTSLGTLPVRPPEPRVTHRLDTGIGPAFGIDARLGSARVALVPSVRLLRTAVSNGRYGDAPSSPSVEIESIYPGGYPEWTLRAGAAVRVRF